MIAAPQRIFSVFLFAAVLLFTVLTNCHAEEASCAYLNEGFSGGSGKVWTVNSGSWTVQTGRVQASITAAGSMGSYKTDFSPPGLFSVDVDVEWVAGSDLYAGYGIFPYTSSGVYFDVAGHDVSGVGAIVYPNLGKARLLAWDVPAQTWHQSEEWTLPAAVTSVGVAYRGDRVVLRVNKSDTAVYFSGDFSYAAPGNIDTFWLFAQNAGTVVLFDNVCASSSSQPSQHLLTVTKAGSGTGLVQSSPSGINCGTTCTASFNQGGTVTLSAVPDATSVFTGWTGGGCSGTGDCLVQMQSDINVTAQFDAAQPAKMPLPVGQIIIPYEAGASPVVNSDPLHAKPVGFGSVAEGGYDFILKAALGAFAGPVDIYFGLLCPALDPNSIILIKPGGQIGFLHQDGLVPWKSNVTEVVEESALPDLLILDVPSGGWYVYVLVAPHGDLANYYMWATRFFSLYELEAVVDRVRNSMGEEDGFDAVVRAVDRGYELWEVVDAAMTGRLSVDGIVASAGGPNGADEKRLTPRTLAPLLSPQDGLDDYLAQARSLCSISGAELTESRTLLYIIFGFLRAGYTFEQIVTELLAGGRLSWLCSYTEYKNGQRTGCQCLMGLFESDCTFVRPQGEWKQFPPFIESSNELCGPTPTYAALGGLAPEGGDGPCAQSEPVIPIPQSYSLELDVHHTRVPGDTSVPEEDWHIAMGTYNIRYSMWHTAGNMDGNGFSFDAVRGDTKIHVTGILSPNADEITQFTYSQEDKYWTASFKGGPIPFIGEFGNSEVPGRAYELRGQAICDAITDYKYDWPKDIGPQQAHYARELVCDEYSYFNISFYPTPPEEF